LRCFTFEGGLQDEILSEFECEKADLFILLELSEKSIQFKFSDKINMDEDGDGDGHLWHFKFIERSDPANDNDFYLKGIHVNSENFDIEDSNKHQDSNEENISNCIFQKCEDMQLSGSLTQDF
jgi:hypothetical protein